MSGLELLAPAGTPEALDAAVGEGADAVYLGLRDFNARLRSTNFSYTQFELALRQMHRRGRRVYVAVNTVFQEREADRMFQLLAYLDRVGADALIVQDFGVLEMLHSCFPRLKVHASTQMNVASANGANALSRWGVSRVVLARELSFAELEAVRPKTNVELEVFVHGSLCVSVSGICLFSSFLGGKSANRGLCTQACRRRYSALMGKGETGASGYFFSPLDLQLLGEVPRLAAAGVNALKIEGRMKSADYVGTVTAAYRRVVDAVNTAPEDEAGVARALAEGEAILRGDFAREKTTYFFFTPASEEALSWLKPAQDGGTGVRLGKILRLRGEGEGRQVLLPKGPSLAVGDSVRFHRADDSLRRTHKVSVVEEAPKGRWIDGPSDFAPGDAVYLIHQALSGGRGTRRYERVIPAQTRRSGHGGPGFEHAPAPQAAKREAGGGPAGVYVEISRVEDMYIAQAVKPAAVILELSGKNAHALALRRQTPLPFRPADTILAFSPVFPEGRGSAIELAPLVERGYTRYVCNNLGQLALFRPFAGLEIIAGPYLYTFNRWALAFVRSLGMTSFVTPLENSRQNLERTLPLPEKSARRGAGERRCALITVYARPPLFHLSADLSRTYGFDTICDGQGETFQLVRNASGDGAIVQPERPFSIVDKIPFLRAAGFGRFIVDFTGRPLRKAEYKAVMKAVTCAMEEAGAAGRVETIPGASRFNWKDGFFTETKKVIDKF